MLMQLIRRRALYAYPLTLLFTSFYIVIYSGDRIRFQDSTLQTLFQRHVYSELNPVSFLLRGQEADRWFFYGTVYTLAVLIFGIRMLFKYSNNPYQIIRTLSVMFFQLGFAYLLPNLLVLFKQPEFYFSYFWPLKPEYLYPSTWLMYAQKGSLPLLFLGFACIMSFVATPILTYYYGKRWYCSWVCGCGALANTLGDPFRQLSDKSDRAWWLERWLIYPLLFLIILITVLLWINSFTAGAVFGDFSQGIAEWYGFYIGAIFSGVIGVGFYPLLGTRIWCRFGCPMAAVLGLLQVKASRFRISTNGGHCISCGHCSTYCEMGIDVRRYAQNGEDILRASCVGCGICSAVCPRGVLRLESGASAMTEFVTAKPI